MSVRVVVTLHLPMEMGVAARIMKAVAAEFPDAVTASPSGSEMHVQADDDWRLTKVDRRRIARERRQPAAQGGGE